MSQPFIQGVNYWPRRKAMYWWSDFDAAEVREEFAIIREIGMQVVRIFLLWDDFQPTPDTVSSECMKNLATVFDIAAENNLGLDVTFFTGHMSGPNWAPKWMLLPDEPMPFWLRQLVSGGKIVDCAYRNYYDDQELQDAQRLLLKTVVSEFKDHSSLYMWNLGNEPDLFAVAPTHAIGDGWVSQMTGLIKSIDPNHPVTTGLHSASIFTNFAHRIDSTFKISDVAVMHSYPMYVPFIENPLDPDWVPFTCALTTALCGRPTLMEEWGGCTALPGQDSYVWEWNAYGEPRTQFMASEEDFAAYIKAVLPKLVEVGATGSMMWCFADYVDELADKPPCLGSKHEQYFGLIRKDGSLKPHAQVIKEFAASNPIVKPPTRTVTLNMTPDQFYENPWEHTQHLYAEYLGK